MKKVGNEIKKITDPFKLYDSKSAEYKRIKKMSRELKNYEVRDKKCDAAFKKAFKPYVNYFRNMAHDSSSNIDEAAGIAEEMSIKLIEEYAKERKIVLKKELKGLERKIDRKLGLAGLNLKGQKLKGEENIKNKEGMEKKEK